MSAFGSKRKARVIKVSDDQHDEYEPSQPESLAASDDGRTKSFAGPKGGKKSMRQSGLRKTLNFLDQEDDSSQSASSGINQDEDGDNGPVVIRPGARSSASSKSKKKSFKPSSLAEGAGKPSSNSDESRLAQSRSKISDSNAFKRAMAMRGLPLRSFQDDDARPTYSKEYLDELRSSTPNTPGGTTPLPQDADEMDLDSSELDGAVIVNSGPAATPVYDTQILTDAEIRERKERRSRLAQEQDFLSVEGDDDDGTGLSRKKKDDTRLTADEQELGEGFDDYVEDGGLALGKRAEKERRTKDRRQMADLISAAEGHSSDSSSDEDAERRIAYEAAQSRAGLDGLQKPRKTTGEDALLPPKITQLPVMEDCLARLKLKLEGLGGGLRDQGSRIQQLENEKIEIEKREAEVQALLDETGRKYQSFLGDKGSEKQAAVGRGLETLGTVQTTDNGIAEDDIS